MLFALNGLLLSVLALQKGDIRRAFMERLHISQSEENGLTAIASTQLSEFTHTDASRVSELQL